MEGFSRIRGYKNEGLEDSRGQLVNIHQTVARRLPESGVACPLPVSEEENICSGGQNMSSSLSKVIQFGFQWDALFKLLFYSWWSLSTFKNIIVLKLLTKQ